MQDAVFYLYSIVPDPLVIAQCWGVVIQSGTAKVAGGNLCEGYFCESLELAVDAIDRVRILNRLVD
jgi:hypothetical protein